MCVLIFIQIWLKLLTLRRNEQGVINNVYWSSCKVLILVRFQLNLNFLDKFSENTQILNFIKIRTEGAKFHADGRTGGHDEASSHFFRNFANKKKKNLYKLLEEEKILF
jgi:hypothetical protein